MKKILAVSIFILLFVFTSRAEAAIRTYNFTNTFPGSITINSETSATFKVTFPVIANTAYIPKVCISLQTTNCLLSSETLYTKSNFGTVRATPIVWEYTYTSLDPTKLYYLNLIGPDGYSKPIRHTFSSSTANFAGPVVSTSYKDSDSGDIIVSTKIDPVAYPTYQDFSATLLFSKEPTMANPVYGGPLVGKQGPELDSANGINRASAPGTFFWRLLSAPLSPNTVYHYQITVLGKDGRSFTSPVNKFNTAQGLTLTAEEEVAYNTTRSYTLLSGFPNFTVLPDPDLCAEQRAAGLNPQFCDMNDVINYGLKLMIGLAAVVLVFRLMFEGYQYMVTDVPFLKASSKGAFFAALGGLLLALSSYIILNTINPKLVNSTVGVNQLAIGIDYEEDGDNPVVGTPSGTLPTGRVAKCAGKIDSFNTAGGKFWACSTIGPGFTTMMKDAYAAGIKLGGGGFRTGTEQIALRSKNCGASNVYNAKARCNPPTATPGNSNHESGLAFDLTCEGSLIRSKSNKCFLWLKDNAGKYGLKNFPKEAWHWSTTGG